MLIYRWCVLFSHPSDFTPVCTTELGRLAVHKPHFEKRNVKLLAHSVDELKSHVDWVNVSDFLISFEFIFCTSHTRRSDQIYFLIFSRTLNRIAWILSVIFHTQLLLIQIVNWPLHWIWSTKIKKMIQKLQKLCVHCTLLALIINCVCQWFIQCQLVAMLSEFDSIFPVAVSFAPTWKLSWRYNILFFYSTVKSYVLLIRYNWLIVCRTSQHQPTGRWVVEANK